LRQRRVDEGVVALADRVELADGRVLERDYVPVRVAGVAEGHFWCLRDVTERERASSQLTELSNRDALTGLYNRGGFMTLAEQWLRIAERTCRAPLLLFIDVNGMKPINDRLGHATGDQVLRDIADLIRTTFRESDIMARLGGDEFVVLAVDASPERASLMSDRLQQNVRAFNAATPRAYRVSVSIGISIWDPTHPRSIEELLAEADAHMYAAKRQRLSNKTIRISPV
jgi:diguanylate cyclase (GGDEF)-like protein